MDGGAVGWGCGCTLQAGPILWFADGMVLGARLPDADRRGSGAKTHMLRSEVWGVENAASSVLPTFLTLRLHHFPSSPASLPVA